MMEPGCESVLKNQSAYWGARLPEASVLDSDDLYQMGWFVYRRCLKRWKDGNAKLTSYFWKALSNKFRSLVQSEWKRAERNHSDYDVSLIRQEAASPERLAMVKQYIDEVSKLTDMQEIDIDGRKRIKLIRCGRPVAELLALGIPDEFFKVCRRRMRCIRHNRGWDVSTGCFSIDRTDFEKFYGVGVDRLRLLHYNIIG